MTAIKIDSKVLVNNKQGKTHGSRGRTLLLVTLFVVEYKGLNSKYLE